MLTININNKEYGVQLSEGVNVKLETNEVNNEKIIDILNRNSDNIGVIADNEEFILIGEITLSGHKEDDIIIVERIMKSKNVF